MRVRVKTTDYVAWPEITVYLGFPDSVRCAKWLNPVTIVQGSEGTKLCNAASSPDVVYVSRRAKKDDDVTICLHGVMRSEQILLPTLVFLNLGMASVVHYEAKGPRVHCRGVRAPDSLEGLVCLLTLVLEALFSTVNRLELFEIVRELRFGATESWLAFRRSREIDWSRRVIDNKCFPYSSRTGTVHYHSSFVERAKGRAVSRLWLAVGVSWAHETGFSLFEGR